MEGKDKKETPMDLMGKTDMKSQIEFMESMNSYFSSPVGFILNSTKDEIFKEFEWYFNNR